MAHKIEPQRRYRSIRLLDGNNLASQKEYECQVKYYTGKDYEAIEKARLENMMKEMMEKDDDD